MLCCFLMNCSFSSVITCFQIMERYLEDYNLMSKAPMDLVMFRFAIEHVSRLSRVLKQPNGHCLCVGTRTLNNHISEPFVFFYFECRFSWNFSIRFWRQYLSLLASIAAIVSLLLTSDRKKFPL